MAMTFLDIMDVRKNVYSKIKYRKEIESWCSIVLTKWIARDIQNIMYLRKIIDFQYNIDPKHYYYLLHFGIRGQMPYEPFPKKKKEEDEPKIELRIREVFDWTKKELEQNRTVVNDILKNEKYWKEKLGIK